MSSPIVQQGMAFRDRRRIECALAADPPAAALRPWHSFRSNCGLAEFGSPRGAAIRPRPRTRAGAASGHYGVLICAWPLLLVLSLEELHIDFRAVDADQFASAISQAGRR
jgi:hypothetical protein